MHALIGDNQTNVVIITLAIVCILFAVQRAGTSKIGRAFGPVMTFWFLFLGGVGLISMFAAPQVLLAINPIYGIQFLFSPNNHAGIMILGSCFLATTGAEALYSDMGHVGKGNIYATWPFVKVCLILSYLGQGAWLLANQGNSSLASIEDLNPFFQMLPDMMRPFGVVLSALAAIIASQALITGAFSLVSEASRLDLMPHLQVFYPAETKGQLYIPLVNKVMWVGCIVVVLLFQSSAHMEAAYGLAITITMLCTTVLLFIYLHSVRKLKFFPFVFVVFFVMLEGFFFGSSLTKFFHGGYFTILLAALIMSIMLCWYAGTAVERVRQRSCPSAAISISLHGCATTRPTTWWQTTSFTSRTARTRIISTGTFSSRSSTSTPSARVPGGSSTSRSWTTRIPSRTRSRTSTRTTSSACTCSWAIRSTSA